MNLPSLNARMNEGQEGEALFQTAKTVMVMEAHTKRPIQVIENKEV